MLFRSSSWAFVHLAEARFPMPLSEALQQDRTTARLSLHLRFAEPIPKSLQGVFSDTAAGIAAAIASLNFPTIFQAVTPEKLGDRKSTRLNSSH